MIELKNCWVAVQQQSLTHSLTVSLDTIFSNRGSIFFKKKPEYAKGYRRYTSQQKKQYKGLMLNIFYIENKIDKIV
jgi:hypothetical protein